MSKKNEPNPKPKADVNDAGASGAEFRPSFGAAVICVVSLIVFMAVSIFFFDQKMHVAMMASLGVTLLVLKIEKCPCHQSRQTHVFSQNVRSLQDPTLTLLA